MRTDDDDPEANQAQGPAPLEGVPRLPSRLLRPARDVPPLPKAQAPPRPVAPCGGRPLWRPLRGGGRELIAVMPSPGQRSPPGLLRALLIVLAGAAAGLLLPFLFLLFAVAK